MFRKEVLVVLIAVAIGVCVAVGIKEMVAEDKQDKNWGGGWHVVGTKKAGRTIYKMSVDTSVDTCGLVAVDTVLVNVPIEKRYTIVYEIEDIKPAIVDAHERGIDEVRLLVALDTGRRWAIEKELLWDVEETMSIVLDAGRTHMGRHRDECIIQGWADGKEVLQRISEENE